MSGIQQTRKILVRKGKRKSVIKSQEPVAAAKSAVLALGEFLSPVAKLNEANQLSQIT